jgi:hypothetical protein
VGHSSTGIRFTSQAVNIGVAANLVSTGAVWKYLDNGSDQGTAWFAPLFDDTSWLSGASELGYGDGDEATVVNSGPEGAFFITTYFRKAVEVGDVSGFASVTATLERDDAAVVYLNGKEIFRTANLPSAPDPILFDTVATGQAVEDSIDSFPISPTNFVAGVNVFAIEIHQQAANSSDISLNFGLRGIPIIIHNLSPNVEVTTPTNGQYFVAPASINLAATASDNDGTVSKVEFFSNGVKIGEDTTSPYEFVWNSPPVAAHKVTAVATDDQGATTTSEEVLVVVYDAAGTPVGAVTSPVDGFTTPGPTNWLVTATANAIAGVGSVQFRNNGVPFGTDNTSPYSATWVAPFGTNLLTVEVTDNNGVKGTSPVVRVVITIPPTNVVAPVIATQSPVAGATLSNLTSITVVFSENVQLIDPGDLLINGIAATAVSASNGRSNYTFNFPQPPYGPVSITWDPGHGIRDYGWPEELAFDASGPGATWTYTLLDKNVPLVSARTPAPGAIVTNLTEIQVTFNEPVTGVDAADLLVNNTPALGVVGSGTSYTFAVPTPASSGTTTVNVTWTTNNGIFDLAVVPNAFVGTLTNNTWRFVYDPRVSLIQSNSTWRFVKGLAEPSDPVSAWRQRTYNDSAWSNAPAPFYFGDPYTNAVNQGTLLSDMNSNYTTIYLRKEFFVANRGEILSLVLNHQTDDGLIAWLNGVEVLRYNVPNGANGDLPYTATASTAANEPGNAGAGYIVATLTNAAVSRLLNGTNVLAIQAFNQSLTNSSDFGFNAHLYYFPIDPSTVPPRVVSIEPPSGDIFSLTQITYSFSEGVTNVRAQDLLINGTPATSITSTTNSTYTFHFPQPPYGPVTVRWDTNETIIDFDTPAREFDGQANASRADYVLLDPSTPRIVSRQPAPNTVLTGLTSMTITFDETVTGLQASDLLVSGTPAVSVISADARTFIFNFVQPSFGTVSIRWATNHGITDLSVPPAPFYPTRFGHQWDYTLIDPVPSITVTSPTNNTYFLPPATVTVRATASDNDGTVASVELYQDGSKLAEFTSAPYVVGVSNLGLGAYTFSGIVRDNQGLLRTSAPVVINVVTSLPIALVRGPYLQMGTTNGGVVRWRTDVISDGLVYYGTNPNNLTNVARENSVTNEHIVSIGGLSSDKRYFYSVGSAAFRLVGGDKDGANYWFDTAPPVGTRRPVRFWALGDSGTAGNGPADRVNAVRDAYLGYAATNGAADLWLMLGDNAYNSGTDNEHQAAVFDVFPTILRNKFLWPTLGNHETGQSTTATDFPYLNIFSLPKAGEAGGVSSGTELYYSFDYANIHFVCLDAMTSGRTATTPMARWLENDLTATAQEWIVVYFHHSLYTKGTHDSDTEQDLVELRQNLNPILEANGVDMVLMGHSHVYERSYLLDGHYGLSSTMSQSMKVDPGSGVEDTDGAYRKNAEGRGVVYTICGCSGQALGGPLNHPAHYVSINELGSLIVEVTGNRLEAKFLNSDGAIRDYYTITKPAPFPPAPEGLVAVGTAEGEISLTWTDAASNETGYAVERSTDGINFTTIQSLEAGTAATVDYGLSMNQTYFYRVRGTNSIGVGDYSNVASASTVLPTSAPRAPSGLVARSDNGVEYFRSQMVLRWQDRSTNESSFQIERSVDGTTFVPAGSVAANLTTFVDRNLSSASYYYYRVRAANAMGLSTATVVAGDETHPQSQLARVGDSVELHAGAEGTGAIRYQWRFLGASLAGQTNETLVLDDLDPTMEGDYTVVIWDATGRQESNPAYVLVVSAPQIITQPLDRVGLVGNSTLLSVGAVGTAPTTYQWYHNGALMPGATAPTLNLIGLQFADGGSYHAVIANEFGSATTREATLTVYGRPVLVPVTARTAEVLTPLALSIGLIDPNTPKLPLTFSLGPGAPTNATIHPTTGAFQWTPTRSQAPGVYPFTVIAQDTNRTDLRVTTDFIVTVIDYLEISTTTLVMNAGESNTIPIDLFSSAPLHGLQVRLTLEQQHLKNLTIETMLPDVVSTVMDATDPHSVLLTFSALAGQSIQGTQQVARIHFRTTADQPSALAHLIVESLIPTRATEGPEPTMLLNEGRVVVLGVRPLLEARMTGGQRQLAIYGRLGSNYTLQSRFGYGSGTVWANRSTVTMTNTLRVIPAPSATAPIIFFQLRQ